MKCPECKAWLGVSKIDDGSAYNCADCKHRWPVEHPWDVHQHRDELGVTDQASVFHPEKGQLCWWEYRGLWRFYFPIRFKDVAAAWKWVQFGTIAELQEGMNILQVGFSKVCFEERT